VKYLIKIFDLKGENNNFIKLEFVNILSSVNISGGYDI